MKMKVCVALKTFDVLNKGDSFVDLSAILRVAGGHTQERISTYVKVDEGKGDDLGHQMPFAPSHKVLSLTIVGAELPQSSTISV